MRKAPVKLSPPTNERPPFMGWMTFLSPNYQNQSSERKNSSRKLRLISRPTRGRRLSGPEHTTGVILLNIHSNIWWKIQYESCSQSNDDTEIKMLKHQWGENLDVFPPQPFSSLGDVVSSPSGSGQ